MYKTWTESEKQYVINNATSKTDGELYEELKRMGASHTISSVRKFRQRNSIVKKAGRPPKSKVLNVKEEENVGETINFPKMSKEQSEAFLNKLNKDLSVGKVDISHLNQGESNGN